MVYNFMHYVWLYVTTSDQSHQSFSTNNWETHICNQDANISGNCPCWSQILPYRFNTLESRSHIENTHLWQICRTVGILSVTRLQSKWKAFKGLHSSVTTSKCNLHHGIVLSLCSATTGRVTYVRSQYAVLCCDAQPFWSQLCALPSKAFPTYNCTCLYNNPSCAKNHLTLTITNLLVEDCNFIISIV